MVDSKQQWKAWVYLSPAIILLLVFTVWPIINTLRMAFLEGYSAQAEAGGAVFNSEQMMNVAKLWDLANIKNLSTPNILNNSQNMKTSENYTYQMYGNMVFDGNNPEEVFKQFCDFMKHNRYKSK